MIVKQTLLMPRYPSAIEAALWLLVHTSFIAEQQMQQ